jgi:hypothetical protein
MYRSARVRSVSAARRTSGLTSAAPLVSGIIR